MNPQSNPTSDFLGGMMKYALSILLTPFYYTGRNDMGVRWTAVSTLFIPGIVYTAVFGWLGRMSEANASVTALFVLLLALGFVRNAIQARNRRRLRDWSVHSWSTGRPLLEPVAVLFCRAAYRAWGTTPWIRRTVFYILNDDFIYYRAEPAMLVVGAVALRSIGATVWFYPIFVAVALIIVRSEMQLSLYLTAHEVMDGKKLEYAIKATLEGRAPEADTGIPIAQIPAGPAQSATDATSVFDRLSPELQILLTRDRAMQP